MKKGIKLVTTIRRNMKNKLMIPWEKLILRSRGLIESVNNRLKNGCQIEHHRHRSPINFLANLFGGLVSYQLQPKKPSLCLSPEEKQLLAMG
ncbi:MAG: transposase [Chlamydiota bacterium]